MTNVVENTKIKNKKLEEDLVCLKRGKNELTERVYQIIENTKNIPLSKSYSQSLTGTGQNGLLRASVGSGGNTRKVNLEVFISKEDRRRFIDAIVNDNKIKEIFCNENFPTVNTFDRKLPSTVSLKIMR